MTKTQALRSFGAFITITVFSIATVAVLSLKPVFADDSIVPGQYIVVLKDSAGDPDAVRADISGRIRGEYLDTYRTAVRGFSARLSGEEVQAMRNDPRVAYVAEDRIISAADTIDRSAQERVREAARYRYVFVPTQAIPTGVSRIKAVNKPNKGSGVHVAVIDTGIDTSHQDLAPNIAGGRNCTSSNPNAYADQNGHGTHVAGTIAAADNGRGVVGVAPQARLWAVRVLDANGSGTWSSVICGLDFVAGKAPANGGPITVANLSLSGGGASDGNCGMTNNDPLHQAVCRVRNAGVTIIAAAGNSRANAASYVPAAYTDAVIPVSALADTDGQAWGAGAGTNFGADDTFASFSNYGSAVAIGAPGVNIYSTWPGNRYAYTSGTSMAAPHAAGAAALYIAAHPGAAWTQVRDALIAGGELNGAGHTDPSGLHPERILRADTL